MKDDATGEARMQRADDTEEALKKRLEGYHSETVPILAHYEKMTSVTKVEGDLTPAQTWEGVEKALN